MSINNPEEYDFWKDENGTPMVRVRCTGEETPISHEIIRLFWRSMKKEKRAKRTKKAKDVSLDENRTCAINPIKELYCKMLIEKFKSTLTPRQRDVFECCYEGGQTYSDYARENHITRQSVKDTKDLINKKIEKFKKTL